MSTSKSSIPSLDGVWLPVKQELNGSALPIAENSRLIIEGGHYTFETLVTDKGDSTTADGKMDIYGREGPNAGKHFKAIYQLDGDMLTVCYNLAGDSYPTKFESTAGPVFFLCVFKRSERRSR